MFILKRINNNNIFFNTFIVFILLLLCIVKSIYAVKAPEELVQEVADQVIFELKKNQKQLKDNSRLANKIAVKLVSPHLDVEGMSRSVLGRAVWDSMSSAQKNRFSMLFSKLVLRTYSGALSAYTSEEVKVYPLLSNERNNRRVLVKSIVNRKESNPITLHYRLVRIGDEWKIYDMLVEGVSLLLNFKDQYSKELSHGTIENLMAKMKNQVEKYS